MTSLNFARIARRVCIEPALIFKQFVNKILIMSVSESSSDAMSDDQKICRKLEKIYRRCHPTEYGCKVFAGSTTAQGYGRYHLTYPGAGSVNTTVHKAVYILERKEPDLIRDREGRQVSHLCGTKLCTNIEHLVLENASKNRFRCSCQKQNKCDGCQPPCIIVPVSQSLRPAAT